MTRLIIVIIVRILILLSIVYIALVQIGCSRVLYNRDLVSRDPVLVRSGSPSPRFLKALHQRYRIRAIINLTGKVSTEERAFGLRYGVPIFLFHWSANREPPPEDIDRLLKIYRDQKKYPMLVHCKAGADRTGLAVALWRIKIEGKSPEEAITEMKLYRHIALLRPAMQETIKKHHSRSGDMMMKNILANAKHILLLPIDLLRNFWWDLNWEF